MSDAVFSDIDKTIRWNKDSPSPATQKAIEDFLSKGTFIPITGGPLAHVPEFLLKNFVLVESGAVGYWPGGKEEILVSQEKQNALAQLMSFLGIQKTHGVVTMSNGCKVILEGPRKASSTYVTGRHPDYRDVHITTPLEELGRMVRSYIEEKQLPLTVSEGTAETYGWEDVRSCEKDEAVRCFLKRNGISSAYFLGDGFNDLAAMQLEQIIPVGFANSIPEIQEIAKERGIFVNRLGPDGGVVEALSIIKDLRT